MDKLKELEDEVRKLKAVVHAHIKTHSTKQLPKELVYQYILEHPGKTSKEIFDHFGLRKQAMWYKLSLLRDYDLIFSVQEKDGMESRWFPVES